MTKCIVCGKQIDEQGGVYTPKPHCSASCAMITLGYPVPDSVLVQLELLEKEEETDDLQHSAHKDTR